MRQTIDTGIEEADGQSTGDVDGDGRIAEFFLGSDPGGCLGTRCSG